MKLSCPKCGRSTHIGEEVGDFPTRCTCCGAMLRRRGDEVVETTVPPALAPRGKRIARGALAGLLISQTTQEEMAVVGAGRGARGRHGILQPESRKEVVRAHARQEALRKAELQGSQQALGALTWAGLILVGLIGLGVVAMKAEAVLFHPAAERADVLRVAP
ncbi:MAG TPA: hypothetical protein VGN88_05640 [Phycisphaerae bacterium]|jgi:hypothetical protein